MLPTTIYLFFPFLILINCDSKTRGKKIEIELIGSKQSDFSTQSPTPPPALLLPQFISYSKMK